MCSCCQQVSIGIAMVLQELQSILQLLISHYGSVYMHAANGHNVLHYMPLNLLDGPMYSSYHVASLCLQAPCRICGLRQCRSSAGDAEQDLDSQFHFTSGVAAAKCSSISRPIWSW